MKTPAAWLELGLDPATRQGSLDRIVADRGGAEPEELRRVLEAAVDEATRLSGIYAWLFCDVVGGRAVSASLVVSIVDAEPPTGPEYEEGDPRESLTLGLREELSGDGAATEIRLLGVGPAVRVRSRAAVRDQTEVESLQYFVPFPDGNRLAVLSFSTPNVALGDAFGEVFDAIAGTLQWAN